MADHAAKRCLCTGNQGLSSSQPRRPIDLPLNSVECGNCRWNAGREAVRAVADSLIARHPESNCATVLAGWSDPTARRQDQDRRDDLHSASCKASCGNWPKRIHIPRRLKHSCSQKRSPSISGTTPRYFGRSWRCWQLEKLARRPACRISPPLVAN